jgi:hypothetical protein
VRSLPRFCHLKIERKKNRQYKAEFQFLPCDSCMELFCFCVKFYGIRLGILFNDVNIKSQKNNFVGGYEKSFEETFDLKTT